MIRVQAKKNLGQHFLKDSKVAARIAGALSSEGCSSVLEIGPGKGMLTRFLIERNFTDFRVIEIDNESVHYLMNGYPGLNVIRGDFLKMDIEKSFPGTLAVTGNFPYNISTQILFRVFENRNRIPELCGMFQKEVAERICSGPGSRVYGILSVLLQAFYDATYLFTVEPGAFVPPPRVRSGVVRLTRNNVTQLDCDEKLFIRVVKATFNQRRKTLRNSLRSAFRLNREDHEWASLRPEQLSVEQFTQLTGWVSQNLILSE
ncbi:MAG TPA: 16S rRNA (adenine(1518)-N(6)/adenine(1519)-N(6))-dimethyltransferase RsmA [Bacteroidales bacterium]|nr:16S rRNA (adenine(1518)-N(6)/adenine(1519)-N(6))-dimethyltransferase RsmA [Bacteroidales bacterium]HPJ59703.1 16S rRNA (adenine(1518)-N(6)/adenine(1519)-N(6))-dimethyltransferase RsmA [Bacteroidales bacterium]HPR11324.1 16S rRNA (adenine(1518)-N(6)/adenine(1519)-N(6))-dimethyltransferase RsmA [Bacteroidales bacterium]HRW86156.1 16S rRNA (adenine(1518)-N(6)/adenine(1519)-N(6))-dimethyltransferase RsmA [Bacteroidales bacterium]